ncbi:MULTISPECIES: hypothetical protein [Bacillus cereus group]|uniref:hypothetical protein n=1 Tax=Bacillus cereus group TaxID=86661 RepID=UPI00123901F5|nr:hypothetical protein [Bacillus cereus]KAA6457042.1 hypothetical protein DX930_30290 [Bacillus cereus]KAB2418894.1 hypothetical protein F8169_00225 [Bacillus cereus]KAB2439206.1 hypothetical protein F8166_00060 [Bacillus cereus]KAB2470252.1 hypothetical protein F8164_03785 [Bacillus cereus]
MCACKGTGVIQNDIGTGMYQFGPCVCEAANETPEEVDRKRHAVMARLRAIHQLQLEGKWDGETWNGNGNGELHNSSATEEVHEELAS